MSPGCFTKVYGANPLEDGEVDEFRKGRFSMCFVSERRGSSSKQWKGEENVNLDERLTRDSDWVSGKAET
jgi:hypothetical protein